MHHTMHLRPGVAKQPNLELKTQPKQLLGSLPLVIALPVLSLYQRAPMRQGAKYPMGHYPKVVWSEFSILNKPVLVGTAWKVYCNIFMQ